jgi:hypothetical protein
MLYPEIKITNNAEHALIAKIHNWFCLISQDTNTFLWKGMGIPS